MDEIKHSPEGGISYSILGVIGMTPPQVERRLIDVFSDKVTMVLTNVPGPTERVYFAGTPVAGVLGWVPAAGNIGVGVSIFSYDGNVTVALRVDADLVPHPETIIEDYHQELQLLARLHRRPRAPEGAETSRRKRAAATAS